MTTITLTILSVLACNSFSCTASEPVIRQQVGNVVTYTIKL